MAAAYAAVVPLLEVPSGVLADRWSRNRIMVLACVALLASSAIGGLSQNVATYVVAAMVLGAYFALSSGTVDSVVYDTVLEETGSSELVRDVDRPGPDGRERCVRGQCAGRRSARRGDLRPYHVLRHPALRRRGDRGVPALRRAPAAPGRRRHLAAQPRRADPSHDHPAAGSATGAVALGAGRDAVPGRVRVRAAVAGRPGRPGGPVRPLLGGADVDARPRWLPGREARPDPDAGRRRGGRPGARGDGRSSR